jgi:AcrR family transcriptional regulator
MAPRSPRGSLSLHAVLDAALALIDRDGVEGLTIRRLAREVGRPPMSLYTHFGTKRELIDLVFERMIQRLFVAHLRPTWQAEFEAGCRHMRRLLLEHPRWVALLTRVNAPPAGMDAYNRLLGLMRDDGFRPEATMFSFSSIMSYALGFVLVERLMGAEPVSVPHQRLQLVANAVARMPVGSYPRIAAVAPRFERWTFDRVFDLGIRSLIHGIDQAMPRRPNRRRAQRASG